MANKKYSPGLPQIQSDSDVYNHGYICDKRKAKGKGILCTVYVRLYKKTKLDNLLYIRCNSHTYLRTDSHSDNARTFLYYRKRSDA